jgi:hypothetical protein
LECYSNGKIILNDLIHSCLLIPLDSQSSLISSLCLEYFESCFEISEKVAYEQKLDQNEIVLGMISSDTFKIILDDILIASFQKRMHQGKFFFKKF